MLPRRALAHKLFLRFHAVRRAQAALKGWYKQRCKMSIVVQAVGRMWIRRRRLLGVVKIQRLVKVVLKRKHAAYVITRVLRWSLTRKRIEKVTAAKIVQKAFRAFKYATCCRNSALRRIHAVISIDLAGSSQFRILRLCRYRIPIMIQAQFRGFVQRVAFQQRLQVRHRSELQRRICEDLYVVENVHVSFAKALDFLKSDDGQVWND